MANTIKVMIDGMEREITLPDYALESTQEKILKALTKGDKTDKDSKAALDELVKGANKKAKEDKKAQDEADKDRNAQLDALRQINDNVEKTGATGVNLKSFGGALAYTGKQLANFGGAMVSTVATGLITLVSGAKDLGDEFAKLQMTGTGMDTAGMSALNLTTSLNALGMSTESALSVMAEYSSVIQTVGRQAFVDVNKQFMNITGSGTRLGLTLDQAADVLAEDLELRQALGMIQDISTNKQAKLSAQLFEQQLQATTILGKSIDDIRGAAKQALTDNAQVQLAIMQVTAGMDPDAAAEFTNGLQKAAGDMAAVGIDQNIINGVMEAALAPVAFMGPAGAELNKALTALDAAAGSSLRAQIQAANAAKQRGDMDEFNRIMGSFDDEMMKAAAGLDENDLKQLMIQLPQLGPAAEKLGISLGQLRLASRNAADAANAQVNPLAESAKAFDNATSQLSAGMNMAMNNLSGALGGPMQALSEAFTVEKAIRDETGALLDKNNEQILAQNDILDENGNVLVKSGEAIKDVSLLNKEQSESLARNSSIFSAFRDAMSKINDAFMELFNPIQEGTEATGSFADTIRDTVVPIIGNLADSAVSFIKTIKPEDLKKGLDDFVTAIKDAINSVRAFVTQVKEVGISEAIAGLFGGKEGESIGDLVGRTLSEKISSGLASIWENAGLITKIGVGIVGLFAGAKIIGAVKSGIGGLFSMFSSGPASAATGATGSLGNAATGALGGTAGNVSSGVAKTMDGLGKGIQKFSEGVGKGVQALGEGLGKGLGGLFKGLGSGLTALANPAALIGLGALVIAINGIAFAADLAKDAFEPFGNMVKSILEGVAPVVESFGAVIKNVFEGMGAFVAGVGEGIGNVVAKVTEGIASFKTAGAEAESIKLEAQAAAMERLSAIPYDQMIATADAVDALAVSMKAFGDSVGSDGIFFDSGADVDKQNEQIGVFAKFAGLDSVAIMNTSNALNSIADSYIKFASLDAEQLLAVSRSMESINQATQPSLMDDAQQFVSNAMGSVANALGFGEGSANTPAPDTTAVASADTGAGQSVDAMTTPEGLTKDGVAIVNKLDEMMRSEDKNRSKDRRAGATA